MPAFPYQELRQDPCGRPFHAVADLDRGTGLVHLLEQGADHLLPFESGRQFERALGVFSVVQPGRCLQERGRNLEAEVRPGGVPRPLERVSVGCSGTRDVMHGLHARPTSSSLIGQASTAETSPPGHDGAKHAHRGRRTGRLRRRVLAYRAIDFLSTHIPDDPGPGDECLLLVHTRQVVGQVRYRICTDCDQGVITAVVIDERFRSTGLGTRALSHLRSRHPGLTWRSTLSKRTTRDLLRRMRIPTTTSATPCPHAHQTLSAPADSILASG
ncbi:GNAT family N-acetyltransferase [Streptomyces sp. NPDC003480]